VQRRLGVADKPSMVKPRCVLPGVMILVTRRCSERRFFLRPDPEVTQVFEYLLGLLAPKFGIAIHAYVVMSNHYHLVITDVDARLPDFEREFNSLLARSLNGFRGRFESFWDPESYNAVTLLDGDAVVEKMGYALANPVEARLVGHAREWGGATSVGMQFGHVRRVARPQGFFSERMPEVVELELTRPAICVELSDRELMQRVRADVERRERESAGVGRAMGMSRVLRQDWRASPERAEPRFGMKPTIAGRSKQARIEALARAKAWLAAYKDALAQFVSGVRDVVFPAGTWHMRVRLGCCAVAVAVE
jgi:REP element-mobilizing transposase RayT